MTKWLALRFLGGLTCVIVGVLGLVLPVVPGVALIVGGLALLGNRRVIDWLQRLRDNGEKRG